jgi:hypothetical protein
MTRCLTIALLAAATLFVAPPRARAQAPPAAPTTQVLVALTVKTGVARADLMKTLPEEIRATVTLYLDGKIQQWYSRSDGQGVVFIMSCSTVAEAKALMDALPLAKANLATFEFTALAPLAPLRLLLAEPAPPARENPQP